MQKFGFLLILVLAGASYTWKLYYSFKVPTMMTFLPGMIALTPAPRASPTSEWDTAAGHAILLAAGGLVDGPDGAPLYYGKTAFLNRAL